MSLGGRREGGRDTLPAATADQKQNVNRWAWAPMMKPGMAGEPLCLERAVRRFWRVQSAARLSLFDTCEREQVDLLVTELEKKS